MVPPHMSFWPSNSPIRKCLFLERLFLIHYLTAAKFRIVSSESGVGSSSLNMFPDMGPVRLLGDILGAHVAELVGEFVFKLAVLNHTLGSHLNLEINGNFLCYCGTQIWNKANCVSNFTPCLFVLWVCGLCLMIHKWRVLTLQTGHSRIRNAFVTPLTGPGVSSASGPTVDCFPSSSTTCISWSSLSTSRCFGAASLSSQLSLVLSRSLSSFSVSSSWNCQFIFWLERLKLTKTFGYKLIDKTMYSAFKNKLMVYNPLQKKGLMWKKIRTSGWFIFMCLGRKSWRMWSPHVRHSTKLPFPLPFASASDESFDIPGWNQEIFK